MRRGQGFVYAIPCLRWQTLGTRHSSFVSASVISAKVSVPVQWLNCVRGEGGSPAPTWPCGLVQRGGDGGALVVPPTAGHGKQARAQHPTRVWACAWERVTPTPLPSHPSPFRMFENLSDKLERAFKVRGPRASRRSTWRRPLGEIRPRAAGCRRELQDGEGFHRSREGQGAGLGTCSRA